MMSSYFENQPVRLARLLTPSEIPAKSAAVTRHKSSEHQLLQSTVVQGTPLLGVPGKRSDSMHAPSLRLPKLPSDQRLQQFLHRKKIITGLTPRIGYKAANLLMAIDPSENMPPIDSKPSGSLSNTAKSLKPKDGDVSSELLQKLKVPKSHCVRVTCSQSPDLSLEEETHGDGATPRRSLELDTGNEKERPQTLENKSLTEGTSHQTSNRASVDPEELNNSGILMAKRMKIAAQTRVSLSSFPIPEVQEMPQKPVVLRKRKPKVTVLEAKPSAEELAWAYSSLYFELNHAVLRSNGLLPSSSEANYKFFLGPGNNSQLIAFLMKRRWFWTRVDSWQLADFIWTQHKQCSIVEKFEMTQENPVPADEISEEKLLLPPFSSKKKKNLKSLFDSERAKCGINLITNSDSYTAVSLIPGTGPLHVYNRIERNYQLTSKKRLYINMLSYCQARGEDVFSSVPLTFLIQEGRDDPELARFALRFKEIEAEASAKAEKPKPHNLWIIKPGENTNCGHGIHVSADLEEIKGLVSGTTTVTGRKRTYIIQRYIERPLLVNKRKFDIRCYGLLTCFNGHVQGYFYHDGYLRTSSKEFTLKNISNRFIHLTNDAVQKKSEDYGKFENGNKLSYPEFQKYLEVNYPDQVNFWRDIWPQIKTLMTDTFKASYHHIDPHRRKHTFEVLGYDFMIDEKFKVWLIEVNTNPCLSLSSAYLAKLIPTMLDNAFRIAVDPYFPEPGSKKHQAEWASQQFENKFEVVFSSVKDATPGEEVDQISVASEESEGSEEDEAN